MIEMDERGQATLEFLVVTVAFLAIIVAMGAIAGSISDGLLVDQASENAPYVIEHLEGLTYALMF